MKIAKIIIVSLTGVLSSMPFLALAQLEIDEKSTAEPVVKTSSTKALTTQNLAESDLPENPSQKKEPSNRALSSAEQSNLILGKWHCKIDVDLGGMIMSITMQNQFNSDRLANGQGLVNVVNLSIGMALAYDVQVNQTWFIKDNVLYQTITSSSIKSLKSSFYESMFNTQNLLPVGQQESTQIVTLTPTTFVGLYNGLELKCNR